MKPNPDFWRGKRVLITGHSGFKGSWLTEWLLMMGAKVTGVALPPDDTNGLFHVLGLEQRIDNHFLDILDFRELKGVMETFAPEVVLHLAAQSLVRKSYESPIDTFAVNVMGTAHLLEAIKSTPSVRSVVIVTSDKCYENRGWFWGYRETEPMGGLDPYSSSKGCAELVTASYRRSFFENDGKATIGLASARAGNVIGGGDWAVDRLVPDFMRAFSRRETILVRNPHSVRPWQHVLEPLGGYLVLAERLMSDPRGYSEGWNLGPDDEDAWPVQDVVQRLAEILEMKDLVKMTSDEGVKMYEAKYLKLDSSKAKGRLGWRPSLRIQEGISWTADWYKKSFSEGDVAAFTQEQISRYQAI